MFNRRKVSKLEKENKELKEKLLKLQENYNNYACKMSNKINSMNDDYNELQKKYLTVLSNSLQRDPKTGRYVKAKGDDRH